MAVQLHFNGASMTLQWHYECNFFCKWFWCFCPYWSPVCEILKSCFVMFWLWSCVLFHILKYFFFVFPEQLLLQFLCKFEKHKSCVCYFVWFLQAWPLVETVLSFLKISLVYLVQPLSQHHNFPNLFSAHIDKTSGKKQLARRASGTNNNVLFPQVVSLMAQGKASGWPRNPVII